MAEHNHPPASVVSADLVDIRVTMARIDERTAQQAVTAEHRHNNLKQAMEAFVPRREIEATNRGFDGRLRSLEAFRLTAFRLAFGLAGLVVAGLAFLGKLAGATVTDLLR